MKNCKGSIISMVLIATFFVSVLAAGVLGLLNTQRKVAVKKELMLQANNVAETALDYGYSYIINDIARDGLDQATMVPKADHHSFDFSSAAEAFVLGAIDKPASYSGPIDSIVYSDLDVRVLPALPKQRLFIDQHDPAHVQDPNKNQWVEESLVPVVAAVTATQGNQSYTAYVQKSISAREVFLFQHAIFFQGQLHLHRGFRPMGDVHANGNLFLNAQNGDTATYNGNVTSSWYIYRGSTFDVGGTGSDPFGYAPVDKSGKLDFTISGVKPVATGGSGQLKILTDSKAATYASLATDFDSRKGTWKDDALAIFKGHLLDRYHNVPTLEPIGSKGYAQDIRATPGINEFRNDPYTLIQPNLPKSHEAHQTDLRNNLEARASLLFIVEYNQEQPDETLSSTPPFANLKFTKLRDTKGFSRNSSGSDYKTVDGSSVPLNLLKPDPLDLSRRISNPWRTFIVRAYKVNPAWNTKLGTDIHDYLVPITLPDRVVGVANQDLTAIVPDGNGLFEDFTFTAAGNSSTGEDGTMKKWLFTTTGKTVVNDSATKIDIDTGLFDSRLGRPAALLTIDMAKLKWVMEAPVADLSGNDLKFRQQFDPTAMLVTPSGGTVPQWNGVLYVEFPTSLELQDYSATALEGAAPGKVVHTLTASGDTLPGKSRFFKYGSIEKRHPDRWNETDNYSRADRQDKIVPIAKELREYPTTDANKNYTILDERYAIPALQLINGRELPHPNKGNDRGKTEGFTVATNAPVYLVGNYNSDGDYKTGTNIASSAADAYSEKDPGIDEIPAAIFCDTFTVLSNGWGESTGSGSNRLHSFYGANNGSTAGNGTAAGSIGSPPGRPQRERAEKTFTFATPNVIHPKTSKYVEISACIATGEYPIFEFFTHALENYQELYNAMGSTKANPIIFKGSLVAMFHSEIQHIKQAYGRDVNKDIQVYYQQHGAFAISASRYHKLLLEGNFPPGTPTAYTTAPTAFRLLQRGDAEDEKTLVDAGFVAP